MSPLEYLFFTMMSVQSADPAALAVTRIEPASGDPIARQSMAINDEGHLQMKTILMEPRDLSAHNLEAPLRITAEFLPWFKIGADLDVTLDESGQTYSANVSRIERVTDSQGETIQVILEMAQDASKAPEIQPGMTGIARLTKVQ